MKIKQAIVTEGTGGDFWWDRQAIMAGVKRDGFIYEGKPLTPGFKTITQPSEAICIMLILEDGQIAYGDGTSVAYSAFSGRDPVLFAKEYIPIIRGPWGRSCRACNEEVSSIKKLAKISPLIPSAFKQKRREIVQRMPHLPTEWQTASSNIYQDFGL